MASVDMCKHGWPGTGCKECFPPSQLLAVLLEAADFVQPFNRAQDLLERLEEAIETVRGRGL